MPLPLGHAAIGFATHDLLSKDNTCFSRWQIALFTVFLANLPDIDVLIGLILCSNGSVFHRGPTHSILFALIMGFLASRSWKLWSQIPVMSFKTCFLLILSHVVADYFLTSAPVSFYWPFEVSWSTGNSGWGNVLHTVFVDAVEDTGILFICTCTIIFNLIYKRRYLLHKTKLVALPMVNGQALPKKTRSASD